MQDKQLYEYTVIRVVPRVERAEFINVGILMYCKKADFLACAFHLDVKKLGILDAQADVSTIHAQLEGLQQIALGNKACPSSIATLDKASRFRWLSANRSTMIQCAPIHPGYALDLDLELNKLMKQLVF